MSAADRVVSWIRRTAHAAILARLHRLRTPTRPASPISRALRHASSAVLRTSLTAGLRPRGNLIAVPSQRAEPHPSLAESSRRYTDVSSACSRWPVRCATWQPVRAAAGARLAGR
ncbi:hypothetical protein QJS66_15885 [Kocuria rhizophila]|nr:hypothetical protein QJS66_15885 [Kocuria rhizophila]